MKVTTRRWIQRYANVPDCGSYRTAITIRDSSRGLLMRIDVPGRLTRRQAIDAAHRHLLREGTWSSNFLWELGKVR